MDFLETGVTRGEYREFCRLVAKLLDDGGLSGPAQYVESLAAGIDAADRSVLPCTRSAMAELDRFQRMAMHKLLLDQATDQRKIWDIQKRIHGRLASLRRCGVYHAGAGYRTPVAEG